MSTTPTPKRHHRIRNTVIGGIVIGGFAIAMANTGGSSQSPTAKSSVAPVSVCKTPSPVSPGTACAQPKKASATPAAVTVPTTPPPAPAPKSDTVTYQVTGTAPADVTYGPSGSNSTGSVPMSTTVNIPDKAPAYYAISAQLQGDGAVSCVIRVNGKAVSVGQASGGYNIATCEITQGLFGGWEDANAG